MSMCSPQNLPAGSMPGASRRSLLVGAGLAGAAVAGFAGATTASAAPELSGSWRPDTEDQRFTLVVMPDTQYMFDGDALHPAPVEAAFRYLLANAKDENIAFMAHLGDLTQNGKAGEMAAIGKAFTVLDRHQVPYSVLAGNHDVS